MAAKATAAKAAPKEEAEGSDDKPSEPFTWKPKDGSAPIVLPNATVAVPKNKALRFMYQMNKRRGNLAAQISYAMTAADVPEAVQDAVFDLDDDEIVELATEWTSAITGAEPGES